MDCNRILIRGVNWIGDAVMTMPAVRCIRDNFMEKDISMLVKPWVMEVFQNDPNINRLIEYKEKYSGVFGKINAAREIKKYKFDCAVLLQNAFDAALLSFLSRIHKRVGYRRDGRGPLLTNAVAMSKDTLLLHHIDYYLNLLSAAGLDTVYRLPWIYPDIGERLTAREMLSRLKRPVIGLNPGAAYGSAKRWPAERFGKVAGGVINDLGGSVVMFGSGKEHPISLEILSHIEKGLITDATVLNLAGKTSLRELSNLIAECDVLVSNDSGPMHISYAVGAPLVALFGSTSPELTGPPDGSFEGAEFGYKFRIIRSDIDCSPCFERTCKHKHLKCMDRIDAEDVLQSIKELLPKRRAVFFDRDGTLCRDAHYLNAMDDLEIYQGIKGLKALKDKGFLLVGISNQSGIARGLVTDRFVRDVHDIFINEYGFDAFYYCPHHPDDRCACRKPMPGMLLKAGADFNIDLRKSYLVGDKGSDTAAAKIAGMRAIHIAPPGHDTAEYADFRIHTLDECLAVIH